MNRIVKRSGRNRLLCLLLAASLLCAAWVAPGLTAAAAETPTSLGLAEHGIKAHQDGWLYVSGGKGGTVTLSDGTVTRSSDCAGLLYAYFSDLGAIGNCAGGATSQVKNNCVFSNDISEGIPNIHGLALTMPDFRDPGTGIYGHIGIYIGNNEAVDNSDTTYNMRREAVVGSGRNWTAWHVFDNGMKYPVSGWYALDGKMVHYTNYEYDINTTVDGYVIGSDGYAKTAAGAYAPVDSSLLSTSYASASQVAAYLETKYSGKDSTYEMIYGGSELLTQDTLYNGKVTAASVNLRQSATTKSSVVAVLSRDTKLDILETVTGETVTDSKNGTSDKWYFVTTAGGNTGYICSLYVEQVELDPVIQAADGYVTITGPANADIYYTTDGTQPDEKAIPYTEPVYMVGCTYKAVAVQNGKKTNVSTATVLSDSSIFTDFLADDWFFSAVDQAVQAQIFHGKGAGIFDPGKNITRAEFVMALANLDRVDLSLYKGESRFSDMKDADSAMTWAVTWASEMGYVSGYSDGSFHPNTSISREQMCVILANYAGLDKSEDSPSFADDEKISSWASDAVYACRDNGLVSGVGKNTFDPKGTATRAQACVVTVNLYNR